MKRYFDAQRVDQAGRHAVRLEKSIIILFMIALLKMCLTILADPISALVVFVLTSAFLLIGWKGATKRHTGLLLAYQAIASFVFFFIVAALCFSVVFFVVIAAASAQQPQMEELQTPVNYGPDVDPVTPLNPVDPNTPVMMPLHPETKGSVLGAFDSYAPSFVTEHAPVLRNSLVTLVRHRGGHDNQPNPVPAPDPNTDGGMQDVQPADGPTQVQACIVVGLVVLFVVVLVLAFIVIGLVVFLVVPMVALFCSIFFSAATRRMLLIQRAAAAVEASHSVSCPMVEVTVPGQAPIHAYPMQMMSTDAKEATATPVAVPAGANVVYMPQTNMFPMTANGYVANPYSGVIYVSGPDEPRK